MTSLENAAKVTITDLADAAGAPGVPHTIQGLVDLFGGGKEGRSALARELAAERGIKYESARRNVERYTTERGTEKRTPRQLQDALDKIANKAATSQATERIEDTARREGVTAHFTGTVRVSKDERYRDFTVTLSAEELAAFIREAEGHHWKAAADELNYALMAAWDMNRGGILSAQGTITDVDELDIRFGE